jgi:hypothetical protein
MLKMALLKAIIDKTIPARDLNVLFEEPVWSLLGVRLRRTGTSFRKK